MSVVELLRNMSFRKEAENITIPNLATLSHSLPLSDKVIISYLVSKAATIADKIPAEATLALEAVTSGIFAFYMASSAIDFVQKMRAKKIDFLEEFGADVKHVEEASLEERAGDVDMLPELLNDNYVVQEYGMEGLARTVNNKLADYIRGVTGQYVISSSKVGRRGLVKLIMPFAIGATDPLSGDIRIFRRTGVFEPHVLAHEMAHRKGYHKEFEAQVLAYLAGLKSGEPVLVQAALCERLYSQFLVLSNSNEGRKRQMIDESDLRQELKEDFTARRQELGVYGSAVSAITGRAYDLRMKLTGQRGMDDYYRGLTNMISYLERTCQHPAIAA